MESIAKSISLTADEAALTLDVEGFTQAGVDVRGTFTATLIVEGTINGSTWFTLDLAPIQAGAKVTSITAAGQWSAQIAGLYKIRVRVDTYTSGSAQVFVRAVTGGSLNPFSSNAGVDIGDIGVKSYTTVAVGELAGSATAVQMPNVVCKMVKFKAESGNAGNVYIGGSGVTVADGTTDTTTGIELDANEETGWIPVDNLNRFYRISNNAGDDLTYLALS